MNGNEGDRSELESDKRDGHEYVSNSDVRNEHETPSNNPEIIDIQKRLELATFDQLWKELASRLTHAVLFAETPMRSLAWPTGQMYKAIRKSSRGDDQALIIHMKGSKFACIGLAALGHDRIEGYIKDEQFAERWVTGPDGTIEYFYVASESDDDD